MVQAKAPGPTTRGGLNHPFHPEDIEYSLHIVGDHRQAHLRIYLVQPPHQEITLVHAAFHRAERMLDDFLAAL